MITGATGLADVTVSVVPTGTARVLVTCSAVKVVGGISVAGISVAGISVASISAAVVPVVPVVPVVAVVAVVAVVPVVAGGVAVVVVGGKVAISRARLS